MFWRNVVSLLPQAAGWLSPPSRGARWARRLGVLSALLPLVLCGCLASCCRGIALEPEKTQADEEKLDVDPVLGAHSSHVRRVGVDNCATIPAGAIPAARGHYVNAARNAQAAKAEADDFVFYKQEWCEGKAELGPYGTYHLGQVIKRILEAKEEPGKGMPFPVLIQADLNAELNEARRAVLINRLAQAGIPNAPQRVVIGFPEAEGIYGDEAPRIYQQMLLPQQVPGSFTGYGFTGGSFGGGFGAGFNGGFNGGFGGLGGFGGRGFAP